ncbi:hypothetical protein ACH518_08055 [Methylomonas sp. HW2-6]|uniref:hypothetical protein n=1 Tax=Methylomonas sp. HW2-6 TaxID=3376687 RepID=UPI004041A23C
MALQQAQYPISEADWRPTHSSLGDNISFDSVGLSLAVADLYHRIDNEDMRDYLQQQQQQQAQ